ncbi:MAG: hypothetical protein QMD46_14175 [Methanomicrobiales archaeon]|nr:hypothetical protein [Methanomicrobiales archaeon]
MAKFREQIITSFVFGLLLFVVFFFMGLLIEGALAIMGALTLYSIPQFTIPAVLGAFGFIQPFAYELAKRLETAPAT